MFYSVVQPDFTHLSAQLKLLAHPERLRILDAVRRAPECVCHLEVLLGKPQPYVSQQLRLLREAGLICDERDGLNTYYCVCDLRIRAWLDTILGPVDVYAAAHAVLPGCSCPKCTRVAIPLVTEFALVA
jgi:DNA-binding transcriptional ArsR family regulator